MRSVEGGEVTDRTFFVRVNLDDMATDLIGLDSTDERGLWLEGFVVGSRGKDCRVDWPAAKLEGHSFGLKCFNEAEEFRDKQSAKGHASADARRNRKATEVQPDVNHGSTTVQPDVNQTSTHPTTNIQQPITNSEKPKRARQAAFVPPTIEQVREHAQKIGVTDPDKFHSYHASRGWVVGKAPMKSWQHAMQTWLGNQATFSRQAGFAPAQPPRPAAPFDPARRTPMFETRPAT